MFLTPKELKSMKPCPSGYKYFLSNFPNGADVLEVLNDKNIPTEVIYWGLENLNLSDNEKSKANEVLFNINSSNFYHCSHLDNSKYASYSDFIINSQFVHRSNHINNSQNVVNSEDVNNSKLIFNSNFITNSNRVLNSSNIQESDNVISSTSIIESINIYKCDNILGGREIYKSKNITDSSFCANSDNLMNCLFCNDLHSVDFHIFNQPIDERRFKFFMEEYKKIMGEVFLDYVDNWPEEIVIDTYPKEYIRWDKYYENVPEKLWKWAKTLPNYNKDILYTITLNKKILS